MTKSYSLTCVFRALILAYIVTGVLLFVLAFAMFKLGLSERTMDYGITFIYILASAIGGLSIGKNMKQKKYIWGCIVGVLYVAIIFLASLIWSKGGHMIAAEGLGTLLLGIGGGTLGGMIS